MPVAAVFHQSQCFDRDLTRRHRVGIDYYTILDLEVLGTQRYGHDFVDWLLRNKNPLEILFRLADEGGVVLLPGKGFGTPHPSARVSRWPT